MLSQETALPLWSSMKHHFRLKIRQSVSGWVLSIVCCLPLVLGVAWYKAVAESAASLYKQGQAAEAKDDIPAAYEFYQKAYQKDPKNLEYRTSYYKTRLQAAEYHIHLGQKIGATGDDAGALAEFMRALEIDPTAEVAKQEIDRVRQRADRPQFRASANHRFQPAREMR